jgi:signal transduction histidine kinase
LGLSICRSIIEAHGGKLWALPRSPFGTTFYLTLPSAETADRTDLDTNGTC